MKFSEYETPEGFKMAIEQRIRQSAQEQGLLTNRLRQLYVFDRFLARAFAQFGDRLLLKGGVALELQLERARTTRDVDFLLSGDTRRLHASSIREKATSPRNCTRTRCRGKRRIRASRICRTSRYWRRTSHLRAVN